MIQYNNIFKDYLDNSITERVDTPADNKELFYYLPHHSIVREDKETTKVCVIDCNYEKLKHSLNVHE